MILYCRTYLPCTFTHRKSQTPIAWTMFVFLVIGRCRPSDDYESSSSAFRHLPHVYIVSFLHISIDTRVPDVIFVVDRCRSQQLRCRVCSSKCLYSLYEEMIEGKVAITEYDRINGNNRTVLDCTNGNCVLALHYT